MIEETDIYLLCNGKMVEALDASVQSCGIESGSVLELTVSRSPVIKMVLSSMTGASREEVDDTSVFLLHLLYLQLSCGNEWISAEDVRRYYAHQYSAVYLDSWLREVGVEMREEDFIALSLSLLTSQPFSQKELIHRALSLYPLSPSVSREEMRPEWVISFPELQAFHQQVSELGVTSLWRIPMHLVLKEDERKRRL